VIDPEMILKIIESKSVYDYEKEAVGVARSALTEMSLNEFCNVANEDVCSDMAEAIKDGLLKYGIDKGELIESELVDFVVDRVLVLKYIFKIQRTLREVQGLNSSN
jgi:hypothetical protein